MGCFKKKNEQPRSIPMRLSIFALNFSIRNSYIAIYNILIALLRSRDHKTGNFKKTGTSAMPAAVRACLFCLAGIPVPLISVQCLVRTAACPQSN